MKEERIFKLFFALGVTLVVVPLLFASILIVAPQYSAVEIDDVNVVSFEKKAIGRRYEYEVVYRVDNRQAEKVVVQLACYPADGSPVQIFALEDSCSDGRGETVVESRVEYDRIVAQKCIAADADNHLDDNLTIWLLLALVGMAALSLGLFFSVKSVEHEGHTVTVVQAPNRAAIKVDGLMVGEHVGAVQQLDLHAEYNGIDIRTLLMARMIPVIFINGNKPVGRWGDEARTHRKAKLLCVLAIVLAALLALTFIIVPEIASGGMPIDDTLIVENVHDFGDNVEMYVKTDGPSRSMSAQLQYLDADGNVIDSEKVYFDVEENIAHATLRMPQGAESAVMTDTSSKCDFEAPTALYIFPLVIFAAGAVVLLMLILFPAKAWEIGGRRIVAFHCRNHFFVRVDGNIVGECAPFSLSGERAVAMQLDETNFKVEFKQYRSPKLYVDGEVYKEKK